MTKRKAAGDAELAVERLIATDGIDDHELLEEMAATMRLNGYTVIRGDLFGHQHRSMEALLTCDHLPKHGGMRIGNAKVGKQIRIDSCEPCAAKAMEAAKGDRPLCPFCRKWPSNRIFGRGTKNEIRFCGRCRRTASDAYRKLQAADACRK